MVNSRDAWNEFVKDEPQPTLKEVGMELARREAVELSKQAKAYFS